MREFRIRTCSQGVGPLAEPLGSSALDAARFTKPPALTAPAGFTPTRRRDRA